MPTKDSMKKILILTSAGGGGHLTVTKALHELLEKQYHVKSTCIFTDILQPIDMTQTFSHGKITSEDFYNKFIQKKYFSMLNTLCSLGFWYYRLRHKKAEKLITRYLLEEQPDLIISVIPLINNQILNVAHKLDIPFLLMPTDLDATTFIKGIHAPPFKKFMCTLIFDDTSTRQKITAAKLNKAQQSISGLPLRNDFYTSKDPHIIKKTLGNSNRQTSYSIAHGSCGIR